MEKQLYFSPTVFTVEAPFCLVSGDTKAYTLVFHAEEPVTGKMILTADRADGQTVVDVAEFSGKICRYTMCNAMYEVPGPLSVMISVQCGDSILTSNRLAFKVLPALNAGTLEADDRYPVLTKLIFEANDALNAADDALTALLATKSRLLPVGNAKQEGNILCLRTNESTTTRYFNADLENNREHILDAGILDKDTAFIELDADLFDGAEIPESADFGFTFIPVEADAAYDYDVLAEEITKTEQGYLFAFPTESCPLMESVSADELFDVFESVQINGEYPEKRVEAVWETPENVIPDTFLEQHAILPALERAKAYAETADTEVWNDLYENIQRVESLLFNQDEKNLKAAKAYANEKTSEALTSAQAYTNKMIGDMTALIHRDIFHDCDGLSLPEDYVRVKKISFTCVDAGTVWQQISVGTGANLVLPEEIEAGAIVVFDAENNIATHNGTPFDGETILSALKDGTVTNFGYFNSKSRSIENLTIEYCVCAKTYTDSSIQQAILDSWEVAV